MYSNYVKQRILYFNRMGKSARKIVEQLASEGYIVSKSGVQGFLNKVEESGSILRKPGSRGKSKRTPEILQAIDHRMEADDETSLSDLKSLLEKEGVQVSITTIHRWRSELGWSSKGTKYCQMIREANIEKRFRWAQGNVDDLRLDNLIFTDETTVQLENHRRTCCYKRGMKPRYKPRPKHPIKVHVWAGISYRGSTGACIFEGKMNAPLFTSILKETLIPFIKEVYPDGCHLIQDNDPKHCSRVAQCFYEDEEVDWSKTPAESPDLNPIENVWHELKEFIRRRIKPHTKQELIDGITTFWGTVDAVKCQKYINHLRKVIPAVIECNGRATGY